MREDDSLELFPTGPTGPGTGSDVLPGAPLAARMRPRSLDEVVGQEHVTQTLRNALNGVADPARIEAAGLRADARAEQVEVTGFVRLATLLAAG